MRWPGWIEEMGCVPINCDREQGSRNKYETQNAAANLVFHDWAMINLLNGISACGLWLLWRKSPEPQIGIKMATLIPLIFWSAFFYPTTLLPNSSLAYSSTLVFPKVAGLTIYPNAAIGFVLTVLTLIGYRVATAELKRTNAASR